MEHWTKDLKKLNACPEAIEWARVYPSLDAAWAECQHGGWMAWLAGRCSGRSKSQARKRLVLALCEIARVVLHIVPKGEDRPRMAIETVEAWACGRATIAEVKTSAADAAYAVAASAAAYAAYAAYAAACAACAADAADASAAASAAASASADAVANVHAAANAKIVDIMRKHYPTPPRMEQ